MSQSDEEMRDSIGSRLGNLERQVKENLSALSQQDAKLDKLLHIVNALTSTAAPSVNESPISQTTSTIERIQPAIDREPRPRSDVRAFSGEPGDWERFWTQVRVFFGMQPITYSSDAQKIAYIYQRLEGEPLKLVTNMWDKPQYQLTLSNMEMFRIMMESLYLDINKNENASYEFKKLKQTKGTGNAQHIQKFETLALAANRIPGEEYERFKDSLRDDVKRSIELEALRQPTLGSSYYDLKAWLITWTFTPRKTGILYVRRSKCALVVEVLAIP